MSTSAQSIVDAIDAAILAMMAGGGAQSLTVEGRSITYTNLADLQKARAYYQGRVDAAADSTYGGLRICKLTQKGGN